MTGKFTFACRTYASNTFASATWTGVLLGRELAMIRFYGTMSEAVSYFGSRLHTYAWDDATVQDRLKALNAATLTIDALKLKGVKASVYSLIYDEEGCVRSPAPTQDALKAADTQALEFPRGQDTDVPEQVKMAQYEIAFSLLDGFDPQAALENLRVSAQTYSAVRTTYADSDQSAEYLVYGIPTGLVWRWLKPFLVDSCILRLSRAD